MPVIQLLKSLVFNATIYAVMLIYAIIFLPFAIASRDGAVRACHAWCRFVIWAAGWMIGLRTEIRGTPPTDEVMVAAKHQSFFDIIVIYSAMPRPKFIMKRELMYAPLIGQYALRIGCVPVDRGKRGKAVLQMKRDVQSGRAEPGQLVIYPQGTRVALMTTSLTKLGLAFFTNNSGSLVCLRLPISGIFGRSGVFSENPERPSSSFSTR